MNIGNKLIHNNTHYEKQLSMVIDEEYPLIDNKELHGVNNYSAAQIVFLMNDTKLSSGSKQDENYNSPMKADLFK